MMCCFCVCAVDVGLQGVCQHGVESRRSKSSSLSRLKRSFFSGYSSSVLNVNESINKNY